MESNKGWHIIWRTRNIEEIKWIQKYTRGIDLTPWERKDEKKEEKTKKEVKSNLVQFFKL